MESQFYTETTAFGLQPEQWSGALYEIFLFRGAVRFSVDFVEHVCCADIGTALFLSPYQTLRWLETELGPLRRIRFHGDYYCIEYHREEVACNGVLFNDVYEVPFVKLSGSAFDEIESICGRVENEQARDDASSQAVIRSYLQLILALCSREKLEQLEANEARSVPRPEIVAFQELLDCHFLEERSPAFYANQLGLSDRTFGRLIKSRFGKTPSVLIRERVVLEAKRLLHLTHSSIKEIAARLRFEDEYYFSRYFKKEVGIAPQHFRDRVGISRAAK